MFRRLRAWLERRQTSRLHVSFEQGLTWAHEEIIYGRGLRYVYTQTRRPLSAFDRGALEAILAHVRLRESLGMDPGLPDTPE